MHVILVFFVNIMIFVVVCENISNLPYYKSTKQSLVATLIINNYSSWLKKTVGIGVYPNNIYNH